MSHVGSPFFAGQMPRGKATPGADCPLFGLKYMGQAMRDVV